MKLLILLFGFLKLICGVHGALTSDQAAEEQQRLGERRGQINTQCICCCSLLCCQSMKLLFVIQKGGWECSAACIAQPLTWRMVLKMASKWCWHNLKTRRCTMTLQQWKEIKEYLWVRAVFLVLLMIPDRALEMCVHLMEGRRGRGMGGGRSWPWQTQKQGQLQQSGSEQQK